MTQLLGLLNINVGDDAILRWIDGSGWSPVVEALLAPLNYPLDPTRRLFFGFVITSLLLGFLAHWQHTQRSQYSGSLGLIKALFSTKAWRGYGRALIDADIWRHPSTWLDVRLLFANNVFRALAIAPFLMSKLVVIVAVSAFCRDTLDFPAINASYPVSHISVIVVFSICLFVIEDASRYLQHRLMHHMPLLWELHKVHHSAERLTPITLYRQHPLEMVLSSVRQVLVVGSVTGFFVALFPGQLTLLEILGVDALGFTFNALGANLRHSHLRLSFGWFNRWFISPEMHQVHHSNNPKHRNKNFGSCLAIWDRFGGSFYVPERHESLQFGCRHGAGHTVMKQWFSPLQRIGHMLSVGFKNNRFTRTGKKLFTQKQDTKK